MFGTSYFVWKYVHIYQGLRPKPTFCIYDSDDSDVEKNKDVKPSKEFPILDITNMKYYECHLADTFFVHLDPLASRKYRRHGHNMDTDKTIPHVPQSNYPKIRLCMLS